MRETRVSASCGGTSVVTVASRHRRSAPETEKTRRKKVHIRSRYIASKSWLITYGLWTSVNNSFTHRYTYISFAFSSLLIPPPDKKLRALIGVEVLQQTASFLSHSLTHTHPNSRHDTILTSRNEPGQPTGVYPLTPPVYTPLRLANRAAPPEP